MKVTVERTIHGYCVRVDGRLASAVSLTRAEAQERANQLTQQAKEAK